MSFSIYEACSPVLVRGLTNLSGILAKAEASGIAESELIEARLAADMRPLPFQVQSASDSAKGVVARLTGVEVPSMADTEASFAELRERCQRTIAYIQSVDAAKFEGAEDREVVMKFPQGSMTFSGRQFLTGFALPNFYFHVTTAYAILRHKGVQIGKMDYLGGAQS
jgi:hypothetical protein